MTMPAQRKNNYVNRFFGGPPLSVIFLLILLSILIGVILGPLFEEYLVRALRLSEGHPSILFSSTLGNVLWGLLALSLLLPAWRGWRQSKQRAAEQFGADWSRRTVQVHGRVGRRAGPPRGFKPVAGPVDPTGVDRR